MKRLGNLWRRRKGGLLCVAALLAGSLTYGGYRYTKSTPNVPSALVQRTDFVDYVQLHGQVSARKSVTISAPYEAGELQIIQLAKNGSQVKKGDIIVQFDATTTQQNLAQDQSALKSAEEEIKQSQAQARLKEEQDLTDVIKARYDVQSAKLDASKEEIVSKIDGAEANLKLEDAKQKLADVEAKLKTDQESDAADIENKRHKSEQQAYAVQQAERSLASLTLRAPIDGLVTLQTNWNASRSMGNSQPFRQGDRVWAGAAIVELPDLSTTEITGRVDETQRSRVELGQTASVRVDAIPDKEFSAKVADISTIASMDFSGGWPFPRNFSIDFSLENTDQRLRPGMGANVRIAVDRVAQGIVVPAEAVFQKSGESVAYVLRGSSFVEQVLEVDRRSGDEVLIAKGLRPGERVALQDPTAKPE
ncbi:MAG TPA: efflux RND transporter periplasmic adaptor subunit [Candidatus Acidoferrales bacterium]|nr:efflux RND transporter periplasmic adaptor subunit [Candidatus Acidoferrales bacterium]